MTPVTCRLTAKNRDQLRNPTLGNRVWATFAFTIPLWTPHCSALCQHRHNIIVTIIYWCYYAQQALSNGRPSVRLPVSCHRSTAATAATAAGGFAAERPAAGAPAPSSKLRVASRPEPTEETQYRLVIAMMCIGCITF